MRKAVLCTLLVAGLFACSRKDLWPAEDVVGTTTTTSATVEVTPARKDVASYLDDDPALTREIEATIASDPQLSSAARNVTVSVDNGIVTLGGSVANYSTRDELEDLASNLARHERVYDDVQVSPLRDQDGREADEAIAFSLQRSLVDQPRVTIDVQHGIVTLRGEATAPVVVERIASRTPGVKTVVDKLGTSAPTPPTSLVQ